MLSLGKSRAGVEPTSTAQQAVEPTARPTGRDQNGQEAGIRTRTVCFTGRDAAITPQS